MNPFWFVTRAAGIALITIGGTSLLIKKLTPKPSDLVAGAVHFGRGLEEFRKGCNAVIFGADAAATGKSKEATKIPIE
jgi:hypothetical protein